MPASARCACSWVHFHSSLNEPLCGSAKGSRGCRRVQDAQTCVCVPATGGSPAKPLQGGLTKPGAGAIPWQAGKNYF